MTKSRCHPGMTSKRLLLPILLLGMAGSAFAQLPAVPVPVENPITETKRVLGKILFWEEQLSTDNTVACGTCHRPGFGGTDPRNTSSDGPDMTPGTPDDIFGSAGVPRSDMNRSYEKDPVSGFNPQLTSRRSSSIIGAQFFNELLWDGAAPSQFIDPETGGVSIVSGGALESQAVMPPVDAVEMAHGNRDWAQIAQKIFLVTPLKLATNIPADMAMALAANPSYADLFNAAFGTPDITAERIAFALATYERTLVSDQTPFDLFVQGDLNALTPDQQAGKDVFLGNGACFFCHNAPLFTDGNFHNIGVRPPAEDLGRFLITGVLSDRARFKTPGLRNVGLRDRFMHGGSLPDLEAVIDLYDQGGFFADNLDPLIFNVILLPGPPDQKVQLLDFLENGLTDPRVANETFPFDRPTLHSEVVVGSPNPVLYGNDAPGTGGVTPLMLASAPMNIDNPFWKIGVGDGLPGATAVLAVSAFAAPPGTTVSGIPINVNIDPGFVFPVTTTLDPGPGPAAGTTTILSNIANAPLIIGLPIYFQWFVVDGAATGGVSTTQGAEFTIF